MLPPSHENRSGRSRTVYTCAILSKVLIGAMGNAQSAPTVSNHRRRPSNRLSKPLTHYSPQKPTGAHNRWNSASVLDTERTPSHSDWSGKATVTALPQSSNRTLSLEFPPFVADVNNHDSERKESRTTGEDEEEDGGSRFKTSVNGFKRRFSRSRPKSNSQQVPQELRISPLPGTHTADNNETRPPSSSQNAAKRGIGLGLHRSSDITPSGGRRLLSMRRRSLNTPGIATRYPRDSAYHDTNGMYKSPPQMYCCQCGGNTPGSMMGYQPGSARYFGAGNITNRAVSPNELEYSNLGGLKFGSLRVVNGSVSPTPSSKRQSSCPDLASHRDSQALLNRLEMYSQNTQRKPAVDDSRCQSLPQRTFYNHHTCSRDDQLQSQEAVPWNPQDAAHPPPQPTSVSWFAEAAASPASPICDSRSATPVSFERAPVLPAPTKVDAIRDNLFEDEGVGLPYSGDMSKDVSKRNNRRQSSQSPNEVHPAVGRDNPYPLNKSDSGYSSTSGRSGQRQTLRGDSTPSPEIDVPGLTRRDTVNSEPLYRVRNVKPDPSTFIPCGGGSPEPEEYITQSKGIIEIKSHGPKEYRDAETFQWPPPRSSSLVDEYLEQFRYEQDGSYGLTLTPEPMDEYALDYDPFRHPSRSATPLPETLPLIYEQNSNESYPVDPNIESVLAAAEIDPSNNEKARPKLFGRSFSEVNRNYLSEWGSSAASYITRTRSMANMDQKKNAPRQDPNISDPNAIQKSNTHTSTSTDRNDGRNKLRRKSFVVERKGLNASPQPHDGLYHLQSTHHDPNHLSYPVHHSSVETVRPAPSPATASISRASSYIDRKMSRPFKSRSRRGPSDSKSTSERLTANPARKLAQPA